MTFLASYFFDMFNPQAQYVPQPWFAQDVFGLAKIRLSREDLVFSVDFLSKLSL